MARRCNHVQAVRAALALLLLACGDMSFSAGPLACRFQGEYLVTLHAITEGCVDLESHERFAGSFALGCKPDLALAGYSGNVSCLDDSDNIAFACTGQLQGEGCAYELVVERE